MSLLDHYLYFDEDHDVDAEGECSPVDPMHLVELHQRGLLELGQVFSHKGWHQSVEQYEGMFCAVCWDGTGDFESQCDNVSENNNMWY